MADETLKITGGNAAGQTITLEQELVIGRSTPGLGSLGGDSEISRVHARVFHDQSGRLMVEDLGSTNGTFVNGNRISGQQALNPGDQVRVGQTTMSVEGGAGAGATTVGQVVPAAPAAAPPPQQPPTQQLPPTGQQPAAPPPPGGPPPPGPGFAGGPIGGPPQRTDDKGKRNLLIALGAVLLIALVVAGLLIGGVFGGDEEPETAAQTTPTATTPTQTTPPAAEAMPEPPPEPEEPADTGAFPASFKRDFVSDCSSGGQLSRSECQCIIDEAENEYDIVEFADALRRTGEGNVPPKLREIIVGCTS